MIGPILFLCYINDIINVATINNTHALLYGYDTVIYGAASDMQELQRNMQDSLAGISTWCTKNRIKLNVSKTKLCLYGTRYLLNTCKFDLI